MNSVDAKLLNDYQQCFPLVSEPFKTIGMELGADARTVLSKLRAFQDQGAISRVGPVFRPNRVGASTLAAISVPEEDLEAKAKIVSSFPEVNHNYEREHRFNLWFVVTGKDQAALEQAIRRIETKTGNSVLVLPMIKDYHIDLGFHMAHLGKGEAFSEQKLYDHLECTDPGAREVDQARDLIAEIQGGLPLVERPYRDIAERLGQDESEILCQLRTLIESGDIKRFGVVVRHHEFGYHANAMVVWDVPDEHIDDIGERLGSLDCVTLCYQRPRRQPDWPYNLFCMIHGQNRARVLECLKQAVSRLKLEHLNHEVLFSGRRFKQRGAQYRKH